jgi:hypothetical protein
VSENTYDEWPDLHDAVLRAVRFEWDVGDAVLEFSRPGDAPPVVLVASDVSLLRCPREFPWGHSKHAYVNFAWPPTQVRESQLLEVELQTGDVVQVRAKRIAVRPAGA